MFETYNTATATPAVTVTPEQHAAMTTALADPDRGYWLAKEYAEVAGLSAAQWNHVVETNHAVQAAAEALGVTDKTLRATVEAELVKGAPPAIVEAVLSGMEARNGGSWAALSAAMGAREATSIEEVSEVVEVK